MRQLLSFLCLFLIYISYVHTQILYECNFDSSTENCFTSEISVSSNIGIPGTSIPNGPLSDVTSSLEPTDNGEVCKLFYRIGTYTWDMYFCNRGYCPTESNPNSPCKSGKFGSVQLIDNEMKSFQLKTESGGINGVNQQCLIYYYYMSNVSEKIIIVRKEEISEENETIDSVTSSPFNGWIQRKVSFNVEASGYKIYFETQKTSGIPATQIGFDEISIHQGRCDNLRAVDDTTTAASISVETITSPVPDQTSTGFVDTSVTSIPDETTTTSISVETITSPVPDQTSTGFVDTTVTSTLDETTTTSISVETISSSAPDQISTELLDTTTTPVAGDTTMVSITVQRTTMEVPVQTSTTLLPDETTMTSMSGEIITTTIQVDTTTATIPNETTETTSILTEITSETQSTITTPIVSTTTTTPVEASTISTTTTADITTSSYDEVTTQDAKEFSTATPTTNLPVEISTFQSSSSTTTTIIIPSATSTLQTTPVSMETTNITTIPFNVSDTTNPVSDITSEVTITTLNTTTTTTNVNVVISSYDETLPYEKSHIIIMATVIPVLWIVFIVSMFWARRSTDVIGAIFHPFNNLSRDGKSWGSYELSSVSDA